MNKVHLAVLTSSSSRSPVLMMVFFLFILLHITNWYRSAGMDNSDEYGGDLAWLEHFKVDGWESSKL